MHVLMRGGKTKIPDSMPPKLILVMRGSADPAEAPIVLTAQDPVATPIPSTDIGADAFLTPKVKFEPKSPCSVKIAPVKIEPNFSSRTQDAAVGDCWPKGQESPVVVDTKRPRRGEKNN